MTREEAKDLGEYIAKAILSHKIPEGLGEILLELNNKIDKYMGKIIGVAVIEDIKAEIAEEKECAYADFERYKIEYLGVDEETITDELPDDDFRYGMERCLEIINKHMSGKEQR